jgi:hypothetical protein
VYATGGVNVAPAAMVIALLSELVVGGFGKTFVAVRRCRVAFNLTEDVRISTREEK